MKNLANFLAFQAGWFACVLGGARGLPWLGVAAAAPIVALHLAWADDRARESKLVALAVLAGPWLDAGLAWSGVFEFPGGSVAPPWIAALWAIFATTMGGCLSWLRGRYALAAALGALGAPLSYMAGERLGALRIAAPPVAAAAAIAALWGLAFPGLFWAYARLGRESPA